MSLPEWLPTCLRTPPRLSLTLPLRPRSTYIRPKDHGPHSVYTVSPLWGTGCSGDHESDMCEEPDIRLTFDPRSLSTHDCPSRQTSTLLSGWSSTKCFPGTYWGDRGRCTVGRNMSGRWDREVGVVGSSILRDEGRMDVCSMPRKGIQIPGVVQERFRHVSKLLRFAGLKGSR